MAKDTEELIADATVYQHGGPAGPPRGLAPLNASASADAVVHGSGTSTRVQADILDHIYNEMVVKPAKRPSQIEIGVLVALEKVGTWVTVGELTDFLEDDLKLTMADQTLRTALRSHETAGFIRTGELDETKKRGPRAQKFGITPAGQKFLLALFSSDLPNLPVLKAASR